MPRKEIVQAKKLKTWNEEHPRTVPDARELLVEPWESGKRVSVTVRRKERCVSDVVTMSEIQEHVTYAPHWEGVATLLSTSAVSLGMGVYFAATASGRPRMFNPNSRGKLSREGSWFLSLPLMGAGIGGTAYAIWSLASPTSEIREPYVQEEAVSESAWDCGAVPEPGVEVKLVLWNGKEHVTKTDHAGRATLTPHLKDYVLPAPKIPWATIQAAHAAGHDFTPSAATFDSVMKDPTFDVLDAFGRYFPGAPEWKKWEPRYNQLAKLEKNKRKQTAPMAAHNIDKLFVPGPTINVPAISELGKVLSQAQPAPTNLLSVFTLDVIGHFDLEEKIISRSERDAYKNTPEYESQLNALKTARNNAQTQLYYLPMSASVGKYNVLKRELEVFLGQNWGPDAEKSQAPKSEGIFIFPDLPTRQMPRYVKKLSKHPRWKGPHVDVLTLHVDPQMAVEMEKNKNDVQLVVTFLPVRTKVIPYKFVSTKDNKLHLFEKRLLECRIAQLVAANTKTGVVYFQQTFTP